MENAPNTFPKVTFGSNLLPRLFEEPAAHLTGLVNEKGQHHQDGEHGAEVLFAKTIVVAKVVALVLQGIEGFVFDPPPGAAGSHDIHCVFPGNLQVCNPAEPVDNFPILVNLPVLQEIDQEILVGIVKRYLVNSTLSH